MASRESRQTDPLQDLFADIKKILDFIEIKDAKEALKYETTEIQELSAMWMNAKLEADTYVTYKKFWTVSMFQEVLPNVKFNNVRYFMEHPYNVPLDFRGVLLEKGRQAFLDQYEEANDYYRMLSGLPPIGTPESEFIYLAEPMRNQLHASDLPVHQLSALIQNSWMSTDDYKRVIAENPDKKYLKYLGLYKVDIFIARQAKDFDIIRYSLNRSDINPNLIKEFSSLYDDYREYVMTTLYNPAFENIYENYRNFMGMLIMMFVLMQINNKSVEAINGRAFLDDSVLHIFLSMYDIPKTLLMTREVRRDLVINLLQLTREKGTDDVYYDLVKILGYQDVIISKLMLMKGQQFDAANNYAATENSEPYFVQVDIKDKNPYDSIVKGNAQQHSYHKIIDADPTWWDLPDVQDILHNSNYSMSDSKYIMVEAVVHQMKYMFEAIYFARMIMDNKASTDTFMIEIPELFGTEMVSIYDLMVFVVAATCMNNHLAGLIENDDTKLLATAGFNFDLDYDSFMEYLDTCKYADVERVKGFMSNLVMKTPADVSRLFNDVMYPMREWLEQRIAAAPNRYEYIEYESIYRALYTYDIARNNFREDFRMPLVAIRETYGLTEEEMEAFKHFYPRTLTGEKVTIDTYSESRYHHPFLARNNPIDWYIHVVIDTPQGEDDRGYVYFHDILNMDDLRELTNSDGTRVFMDWEDGEIGWEINRQAVEKAMSLIDRLDEEALHRAYFQVDTPILGSNGESYHEADKLPANIRAGLYKTILKEKLRMDMAGLAVPPQTYLDYLYRKNPKLYKLLISNRRFDLDHDAWLDDVMKVVLALETELNVHMKYFEQSVVGSDQFFKPLVTLIKHFKSTFVNFARTGLKYVFGDKIDAGGNSNMFKLFDEVKFIVHFVTLANRSYSSHFGLYDTEHSVKYHIELNDRSQMIMEGIERYKVRHRTQGMGSLRLVDEMKFFLNGKPVDPDGSDSRWISGEPGTGRWSEEDDIQMRARKESVRVPSHPVDMEGWKEFVESYTPIE